MPQSVTKKLWSASIGGGGAVLSACGIATQKAKAGGELKPTNL